MDPQSRWAQRALRNHGTKPKASPPTPLHAPSSHSPSARSLSSVSANVLFNAKLSLTPVCLLKKHFLWETSHEEPQGPENPTGIQIPKPPDSQPRGRVCVTGEDVLWSPPAELTQSTDCLAPWLCVSGSAQGDSGRGGGGRVTEAESLRIRARSLRGSSISNGVSSPHSTPGCQPGGPVDGDSRMPAALPDWASLTCLRLSVPHQ